MSQPVPISRLSIHQLAIPLRQSFKHSAAERAVSEPLIVALEFSNGTIGYGETHPRPYVTGESLDDAVRSIREIFVPILVDTHPANFGEAIEAAANLPIVAPDGRVIAAARAAVELALLDAYGKYFERSLESIAGWLDETWLGAPGSRDTARFSGVISSGDANKVARTIRKMRLIRLPHFKLKVGDENDDARLATAMRILGRGLRAGRLTLRLDANGAWELDQAMDQLASWESLPITCMEQPLAKGNPDAWQQLAAQTNLPLMADESLVTPDDAESLIVQHGASWFNIRISKNGGLIPALRLALLAHRHNIQCLLGCMVGETSILSAAGRWFLQMTPGLSIVEGNFGKFLLSEDICRQSLRFGWAGRWQPQTGPGLGIAVDGAKLEGLAARDEIRIPF